MNEKILLPGEVIITEPERPCTYYCYVCVGRGNQGCPMRSN